MWNLLAALLLVSTSLFGADRAKTPHVEVQLLSSRAVFAPGETFDVGFRFKIVPHWHVYWSNPGDSGTPPKVQWKLPADLAAGDFVYGAPKRIQMESLANYGYDDEALFLVPIVVAPGWKAGTPATLTANLSWLVCREECIPEKAELTLQLPSAATPKPGPAAALLDPARAMAPRFLDGYQASISQETDESVVVDVKFPDSISVERYDLDLFPKQKGVFEAGSQQRVSQSPGEASFALFKATGAPKRLDTIAAVLVARAKQGNEPPLAVELQTASRSTVAASTTTGFWAALLGAFLGGLLLNLMPCVFPVLAIKIVGISKQIVANKREARLEGLLFATGVLLSFWLLAGVLLGLRSAGAQIGWGFQLQSPLFVLGMTVLFLLTALHFFGLFEVGYGIQNLVGRAPTTTGRLGAFSSGVIATAVATPCTAPFMGAALGAALLVPPWQSFLIFTSLGIGMALPYMILGYVTPIAKRLPKPGAWMDHLKQFMGFPMLATCVWLLWVFGQQKGLNSLAEALFGLLMVSMAVWFSQRGKSQAQKRLAVIVAMACTLGAGMLLRASASGDVEMKAGEAKPTQSSNGLVWEPWSQERVEALRREGRTIYVDFTAAWCLTCQVNKQVVFASEQVVATLKAHDVVMLKGDWTNQDPAITKALESFGRTGVPLNLIYGKKGEPEVLPAALTPGIVLDALNRAKN